MPLVTNVFPFCLRITRLLLHKSLKFFFLCIPLNIFAFINLSLEEIVGDGYSGPFLNRHYLDRSTWVGLMIATTKSRRKRFT